MPGAKCDGQVCRLPRMNEQEQLTAERDIARVLAAYARMVDTRDWAAATDVFAPDATAQYGDWQLRSLDAILAMLRGALVACGPTHHQLGPPVVDFEGNTVVSRCSVRAAHRGMGDRSDLTYDCMGEYRDRWIRSEAGWRIRHRQMVVVLEFGTRRVLGLSA